MESWQSCCSYSERQSKDHMGLFAYRFAPISCRNYASASAMKGVLQSIIIDVFNGTLIWRYLDLCMLVFLGQSSSTQWVTTSCHVFSKLNLEIVLRFVVWHIVIWLKMSGWTWSTLLKHLNVMSLPICGFTWPLAEGVNWILRVNHRSRQSLSAKEDSPSHQILYCSLKWLVALAVQGS